MVRSILTGSFRLDGPRTWWADDVYLILGMEPGDVPPTLDVLLRHVEPAWRDRLRADLESCAERGDVVGGLYPVRDLRGRRRLVAVAASAGAFGPTTAPVVTGDLVDLTETLEEDVADDVNARLGDALRDRAEVEQALGVLSLVQGVDRRTALGLLRWSAERRGLPLVAVARRLVAAAQGVGVPSDERGRLDEVVDAATRHPSDVRAGSPRRMAAAR